MSLAPLLSAPWHIQLHAFAAMAAFAVALTQFALPKGTLRHRVVGYVWVLLLVAVSLSSFFIHGIRLLGPFSPIHLLSLLTLGILAVAIITARHGNIRAHRINMLILFWAALVGAGLFTLLPGRIMGQVVFEP